MRRPHPGEVSPLTSYGDINGSVDPAFESVRDAFVNNFIEHGEIGASVCVKVGGVIRVDLWGGYADPMRTRPWVEDQLVNAFSVGKGVTSLLVAQAVDRALFSYDTRVIDIWPEFGTHGKDCLTVAHLLGHRAGLPAVRRQLHSTAMYDWRAMTKALADEVPWWEPGTRHGYHVNTFGFLVGEILRRTTGRSVGALLADQISGPLAADIFLGCTPSLHPRMADFEWPGTPPSGEPPAGLSGSDLMQYNTYYNPQGLSGAGTVNTPEWRQAEIPSTNMHASARGVATLYNVLAHDGTFGSTRLLSADTLREALVEESHGDDVVLGRVSRFARGFQLPIPERGFGPNPESFGHFGAGGSVGFCDPTVRLGFGYVMNQMGPRWQNPRNRALIEAVYSSL